jgi:hypothetical protein
VVVVLGVVVVVGGVVEGVVLGGVEIKIVLIRVLAVGPIMFVCCRSTLV